MEEKPHETGKAQVILEALNDKRVLPDLRMPALTVRCAYRLSTQLRDLRTSRSDAVVGYKIGFTNPQLWTELGAEEPIAGHIYESGYLVAAATNVLSTGRFCGPSYIEPELILEIGQPPQPGMGADDVLRCVSRVALGFELVHSIFAGWEFTPAEAIAAGGLHGAIVVGEWVDASGLSADDIRELEVSLTCNGMELATGTARSVMGSPLEALRWLASLAAREPHCVSLHQANVISSGSMTRPFLVSPDEEWGIKSLRGIGLPPLSIRTV